MTTFINYFTLAHKVGDVKLQTFQYKILNRIFPCNYMLYKWNIMESNKCACGEVDTIEHYFFYCSESQTIWKFITQWMNEIFNVNIPLKIVNVILGIPYIKTHDDVLNILNYLILHGKWYIYWCK